MKRITTGDLIHTYGSFGLKIDYTVRLTLRLDDGIDGNMLKEAVVRTSKRYPYLMLKMHINDRDIYYEDNPEPVAVLNQEASVALGAEETNYHVWAVCYYEDRLFFDFYHGICDGTGIYMVLSTLLYYYTNLRYGVTDSEGIRTLQDEIDPGEFVDPLDSLPEIDISSMPATAREPAFSLIEDGGFTPCAQKLYDIAIPDEAFVSFSSDHDASPGIMVSILMARAVDMVFPNRDKKLIGNYVVNGRPMLHAPLSHHNCVTAMILDYSDKVKAMPLERQCTVYRGKTFIQSDEEAIRKRMQMMSAAYKAVDKNTPTVETKMDTFARFMEGGRKNYTIIVSYVGRWKHPSVGEHVREFWTHVPNANDFLIELAAINGNVYLTVHQGFEEDTLIRAFEEELKANGIPCSIREMENDVAHMAFPDGKGD